MRNKDRWRGALGAYLLIVAIAAYGFWQLGKNQDDIQAAQVAACERGNDVRKSERQVWAFFFQVSRASAVAVKQPKSVLKFYDDYLDWVNIVFADRDCNDLTKVYPEPPPPPSYKKALKEAK